MAEYDKNHYISQSVLKNFANKKDNGKYKIDIIDLGKKTVIVRNVESAFYVNKLYDVQNEDVRKLEKDLNEKIEKPFYKILDRLLMK